MMAYIGVHLIPVEWELGERPQAVDVTTVDGETFRYVEQRKSRVVTRERRFSQTQTLVSKSCYSCGYVFGDEEHRELPFPGVLGKVEIPNYCPSCGALIEKE